MSFQSLGFLILLALAVLITRLFGSGRSRTVLPLAVLSLLAYVIGQRAHPLAPAVLILGLGVTWAAVRYLQAGGIRRRAVLLLAAGWHIGVLLGFKYLGFFTGGRISAPFVPLGLSFFTFQQLWLLKEAASGAFTLKKGEGPALLLYGFFFPTVASGPILRPQGFFRQLRREAGAHASDEDLAAGLYALSRGFAKKLLLADPLGIIVANGWALGEAMTAPAAWVVILGYTLRLYLDFSGYCDIASGCARLLGLRLPVNFDAPYRALSAGEFWRRWHITLTDFLRECVYFPLGGSRRGTGRTCLNILLVYLISGFWHGAGWTFLIWGLLHGLAQIAERLAGARRERLPKAIQWLITFLFVNLAWVFFQAPGLGEALGLLRAAFLGGWGLPAKALALGALDTEVTVLRTVLPPVLAKWIPALVLLGLFWGGLGVSLRRRGALQRMEDFRPTVWGALASAALLGWAVLSFSSTGSFIYSNF